ncbi:MAG TPA: universal stress protein [Caulobacteraceae bacterium]|nr:universal stress protein [Caulobacteraceae bacterium]
MVYSDIVVQIDKPEARARYETAVALAARGHRRVAGVYLKTSLINQYNSIDPIAWLPPDTLNQLVHEHIAAQDRAAGASSAALLAIAKRAGVEAEWHVVSGDTPDDLVALARCADLVVLPPPTPYAAYSVHASAVAVGLECGGPILIVPEGSQPSEIGARVLIAWNGGREAARAVRDALPLLAEGAAVEVRVAGDAADDPAGALRRRLEGRGLKVNVVVAAHHADEHVADWLASEAKQADCDMIVMGLYGHTRVREFVLGGVSRGMLHEPPLPLLISH